MSQENTTPEVEEPQEPSTWPAMIAEREKLEAAKTGPASEKWQPGDMPHGETIDLKEFPVEVLKLTQCRSFRADLLHKLNLIVRAQGGDGNGGVNRAARRLRVGRHAIQRWRRWEETPRSRIALERIDSAYIEAIEFLAAQATKRKKRRAV